MKGKKGKMTRERKIIIKERKKAKQLKSYFDNVNHKNKW